MVDGFLATPLLESPAMKVRPLEPCSSYPQSDFSQSQGALRSFYPLIQSREHQRVTHNHLCQYQLLQWLQITQDDQGVLFGTRVHHHLELGVESCLHRVFARIFFHGPHNTEFVSGPCLLQKGG